MKKILLFLALGTFFTATAQSRTKRVLFLGNSYTYVNSLPQMLRDVALSVGDTVIFDSNAPGGYTLQGHSTNATSLAKIAQGNWDYVVLQEQSQLPSFPIGQVELEVFPYARILDSLIRLHNPCAETVFYMTWGRQNGDAANCPNWPPVCTYMGMDSLLNLRYRMMAADNGAILSPVGAVWRQIRQMHPGIGLYQVDASHPSVAGTYAAACSFYSALFRKDPSAITYNPSLTAADAANIRAAAKLIVFDSLMNWHIGEYDPQANFAYFPAGANGLAFVNASANADFYSWDFGDGDTSSLANPEHTFAAPGDYTVALIASRCGRADTLFQTVNIVVAGMDVRANAPLVVYPNPVKDVLYLDLPLSGECYYEIFNMTGVLVQKGVIGHLDKQIELGALTDGTYVLRVGNGMQFVEIQKIVKISF